MSSMIERSNDLGAVTSGAVTSGACGAGSPFVLPGRMTAGADEAMHFGGEGTAGAAQAPNSPFRKTPGAGPPWFPKINQTEPLLALRALSCVLTFTPSHFLTFACWPC